MKVEVLRPPALQKGGTVAFVSPSTRPTPETVERIRQHVEALGFRFHLAKNAMSTHSYTAGTIAERVADIHDAFLDPSVQAVCTAAGGVGAVQLLPELDYALLRRHCKILVGMSNSSILLNAVHTKAGIVTFHGPNGVNLGSEAGLTDFTRDCFIRVLTCNEPFGSVPRLSPWTWLRHGCASGELIGGSLKTNHNLLGTQFQPSALGKIWFWEVLGLDYVKIHTILYHYRLAGFLEGLSGMVIANPTNCDSGKYSGVPSLMELVVDATAGYEFPILFGVDAGHADDKCTLAIGSRVTLDSDGDSFAIVEASVRDRGHP